ncbi:MAG: glycine cleavage system protein GcvH [Thermoplasmata archaeon]
MKVLDYDCPEELYYHKDHAWARVEGELVVIGVTDFAQKMAGTIKRIVTLEVGDEIEQDKPFGTLSSGKWTGKVQSPISGEIVEVNAALEERPKLVNDSPYGEGWMIKVRPSNLQDELARLYRPGTEAFTNWLTAEHNKYKK